MKITCLATEDPKVAAATLPEPLAVLAARTACALEQSVQRFILAGDQDLGHLEEQAARDVQGLLRESTQRAAQAKADATPPLCPVCRKELNHCSDGHARTFDTRFGAIVASPFLGCFTRAGLSRRSICAGLIFRSFSLKAFPNGAERRS